MYTDIERLVIHFVNSPKRIVIFSKKKSRALKDKMDKHFAGMKKYARSQDHKPTGKKVEVATKEISKPTPGAGSSVVAAVAASTVYLEEPIPETEVKVDEWATVERRKVKPVRDMTFQPAQTVTETKEDPADFDEPEWHSRHEKGSIW